MRADLLLTGSWDRSVKAWDVRAPAGKPVASAATPDRVYAMAVVGPSTLVVASAGRAVQLFDLRRGGLELSATRESALKHQTRVLRGFVDGSGFATGSIEGRVAIDFLDASVDAQKARYAFKCHRARSATAAGGSEDRVFPVHAIAFHPVHGTFATGAWVLWLRVGATGAFVTIVGVLLICGCGLPLSHQRSSHRWCLPFLTPLSAQAAATGTCRCGTGWARRGCTSRPTTVRARRERERASMCRAPLSTAAASARSLSPSPLLPLTAGTSVSALAFNKDGSQLAVGVGYMFDQGATDPAAAAAPGGAKPDAIFIRAVADSDVRPKPPAPKPAA